LLQRKVAIPSGGLKPPHVAQAGFFENSDSFSQHAGTRGTVLVLKFD
jgi:hypothetical protein